MPFAAINQHQIRPGAAITIRIIGLRASKPASHNLAHHGEIVVGLCGLDVPLAVLVLDETLWPGNHHCSERIGALNVAVIIDFYALRNLGEFEEFREFTHIPCLGAAFGQATIERFAGIATRLFDQAPPVAALRDRDVHPAPGAFAQGLAKQSTFGQIAVHQNKPRTGNLFIELGHETLQNFGLLEAFGVAGEEGAVSPVLATTNEEGLDRHLAVLVGECEDICVTQPLGVDRLAALNERRSAQTIAQHGGTFKIERLRSLGHLAFHFPLHRVRFSAEKIARLTDKFGVIRLVNPAHAWRRTALDLIEQTGAITVSKKAVSAAS